MAELFFLDTYLPLLNEYKKLFREDEIQEKVNH